MTLIALICLFTWVGLFALAAIGTAYSHRHFSRATTPNIRPCEFPPISILKPLKGVDAELRENLESFFTLEYPEYEILFSVAKHVDPACALVRELIAAHPERRAHLIVGQVNHGPNPKVNNLMRSQALAKYEHLLISDSTIKVNKDYLQQTAHTLERDTGVVTAIVAGTNPRSFAGHLEAVHMNTFCARGMLLAMFFRQPCVLGKSMFLRKSTLERIGGVRLLGKYLAEDYMTAQAMRYLGLKISTLPVIVEQNVGRYTFKTFWSRHVRWGRLRKCHAAWAFFIEMLSGAIPAALLAGFSFHRLFQVSPGSAFLLSLGLWATADFFMMHSLRQKIVVKTLLAWTIREVLWLPLWIKVLSNNRIQWQGNALRLKRGGLLEAA